jgi:hypothetical protein
MPDQNDIDLAELGREVTERAKDAFYVAVGFAVLGFQRAQVQRVELEKKMKDMGGGNNLDDMRAEVTRRVRDLDGMVEEALRYVDTTLEPIEERLPASARDMSKQVRHHAREVRIQIRDKVAPPS